MKVWYKSHMRAARAHAGERAHSFNTRYLKQHGELPTGVYLLDFFCSGIQFYLLLSPYPCFISLLYLDLYVLGDDALIS